MTKQVLVGLAVLFTALVSAGACGAQTTSIDSESLEVCALDCVNVDGIGAILEGNLPIYKIECTLTSMNTIDGHLTLRYTNRTELTLDEICLRLFPNLLGGSCVVTDVIVDGQESVLEIDTDASSIGWISLYEPLLPGGQTEIGLRFTTVVPGEDTSVNATDRRFSYGWNILSAAYSFPCVATFSDGHWDTREGAVLGEHSLQEHSAYYVEFHTPKEFVLVASGLAVQKTEGDDETITTVVAGPVNDFYWGGSNTYTPYAIDVDGTTVTCYAPPDLEDDATAVLYYAERALRTFAAIAPYPYTELDLAIVDLGLFGIGGSEFSGAIVLGVAAVAVSELIFGPYLGMQPFDYDVNVELIVVHEVAHQWFPISVGSDPMIEPWLDESVVQLMTWLYFTELYGTFGHNGFKAVLEELRSYLDVPITRIDLDIDSITAETYVPIVYAQGPLVLWDMLSVSDSLSWIIGDMLEYKLTHFVRQTGWQFLKYYFDENVWQLSNKLAFRSSVAKDLGDEALRFLDTWLSESP